MEVSAQQVKRFQAAVLANDAYATLALQMWIERNHMMGLPWDEVTRALGEATDSISATESDLRQLAEGLQHMTTRIQELERRTDESLQQLREIALYMENKVGLL